MFRFNFVQMLSNHFYIFFTDLDPVKYAKQYHISRDHLLRFRLQPSEIQSKVNFNFCKKNRIAYVFPLLIMTYLVCSDLLSVIIAFNFDHSEKHSFNISNISKLLSHRMFPREAWPQGEVVYALGMFMTLSIYICLIFKPHYEFSWLMFLFSSNNGRKVEIIQNGSFLEPKETEGIFQLQARLKRVLPFVVTAVLTFVGLYVFNNVFSSFYHQSSYTLQDCILFILITVFFVPYIVFTDFFVIYFFILCCKYLRVKQKLTVEQLTGLEKQEFISSKISTEFWSFFRKLNSKTLIFQKEIEIQNRLWSIYLSIYFVVYMADICYLSYTFFFVPSTVGFIADVLILAAGNFAIILFYVTLQCSKIVNSSEMMYRQMMRMAMRRFEVDGSKKMLRTSLKNLLEVEQKAAEHADQSKEAFYSFTLVTGHQINSALFQSVATYTLMFFMIVFKDSENIQ